jgi:hypothetical protein
MRASRAVSIIATLTALALWWPAAARAQAGDGYGEQGAEAEAQQPPAPPPPNRQALRALKLMFEQEPTVEQVQKAALKFFHVHQDKVAGYRRGASWKAALPDLELIFNNEMGNSNSTMYDYIYRTFPYKEKSDGKTTSMSLGVRAQWSLPQIVFNAETLDVASLVGVQEGLLREVTSLYFTRRRLLTSMVLNPPQDPNEQITEELRLGEITANIDALTGGFFSREKRRRMKAAEGK